MNFGIRILGRIESKKSNLKTMSKNVQSNKTLRFRAKNSVGQKNSKLRTSRRATCVDAVRQRNNIAS